LPRAPSVDDVVTGGQDTVGLRCPAHPLARALLQACRRAGIRGLAAPSANRFGRLSPTTAAHVRTEFGPELMVLDGGQCEVGIESTIVAFADGHPRILRPGMCPVETIVDVAGVPLANGEARAPRVSGSLAQHYAPATPLELLGSAELLARVRAFGAARRRVAVLACAATLEQLDAGGAELQARVAAADPAAYAHELYAVLHELDAGDAAVLLVERPPGEPGWEAIHDRLARAAAGSGGRH
jgi:L-threonylcarbamoyladenylate synthase